MQILTFPFFPLQVGVIAKQKDPYIPVGKMKEKKKASPTNKYSDGV